MLAELDTYKCTCNITFVGNKTNNQYKVLQHSCMNGQYRMEVLEPEKYKDTVTICDGKNIVQLDKNIDGKIVIAKPNKVRNLMLLNSFKKNYFQGEESTVNVSKMQESKSTVLEAKIPGDHRLLSVQKLWVDNKTLQPLQMIIYDIDGNKTIIINYEEFEYNIDLNEELFNTKLNETYSN